MITCDLMGGLGNIMFQIAWLKSFAKDNKCRSYFHNINQLLVHLNTDQQHNPTLEHANEYLSIFKKLNLKENLGVQSFNKKINYPFHYQTVLFQDNACYNGFFQSEKYFEHNRSYILDIFQPSAECENILKKYDDIISNNITCSVHVRRGDYIKLSEKHTPQSIKYFNNAMQHIINNYVDKFIIFSDDIKWCKENITNKHCIFIENEKDYIELFLQSRCTHNIISNSSFSWWGAWLNKNPNKMVIAPKRWFGSGDWGVNEKDVIPQAWLKM
tara:strand:+ start:374 stop:1186 length:813 start_codon:yes stop_codon:yes gene_type:complete